MKKGILWLQKQLKGLLGRGIPFLLASHVPDHIVNFPTAKFRGELDTQHNKKITHNLHVILYLLNISEIIGLHVLVLSYYKPRLSIITSTTGTRQQVIKTVNPLHMHATIHIDSLNF